MDREAWRAAINGVAKSQTWLSDWTELNWTESQAIERTRIRAYLERESSHSERDGEALLRTEVMLCWGQRLGRATMEPVCLCAKSLQLCPTLFDPVECNLPGSSLHGVLQARLLEWVATPFFRGSSPPRDRTHVSYVSHVGRRVLYP